MNVGDEKENKWMSCKNKNDNESSRIINWVRSSRVCPWSCGERTSQRIDLDWDESWFSLIVIRELDAIFLVGDSTAVDGQTVEGVEIWGLSLWAVDWGGGCWIWELRFKEAFHFVLISEGELLVSFQNHKHVVNISVDITHQLQPFRCWGVGWCGSGLLLTSVWTAVSTHQVSVVAFLSLLNSSISAYWWTIVSAHWWLASATPHCLNLTCWWAAIVSNLVLIIALLSSCNQSITTLGLTDSIHNLETTLSAGSTNCSTGAWFATSGTSNTSLWAIEGKSSITTDWCKDNLFTDTVVVKIESIRAGTTLDFSSVLKVQWALSASSLVHKLASWASKLTVSISSISDVTVSADTFSFRNDLVDWAWEAQSVIVNQFISFAGLFASDSDFGETRWASAFLSVVTQISWAFGTSSIDQESTRDVTAFGTDFKVIGDEALSTDAWSINKLLIDSTSSTRSVGDWRFSSGADLAGGIDSSKSKEAITVCSFRVVDFIVSTLLDADSILAQQESINTFALFADGIKSGVDWTGDTVIVLNEVIGWAFGTDLVGDSVSS